MRRKADSCADERCWARACVDVDPLHRGAYGRTHAGGQLRTGVVGSSPQLAALDGRYLGLRRAHRSLSASSVAPANFEPNINREHDYNTHASSERGR